MDEWLTDSFMASCRDHGRNSLTSSAPFSGHFVRFAVTLHKESHWVISVWQMDANSISACIPLLLLCVAVTVAADVAIFVAVAVTVAVVVVLW